MDVKTSLRIAYMERKRKKKERKKNERKRERKRKKERIVATSVGK